MKKVDQEVGDNDSYMDGRMSMRSDFSRGSSMANSVIIKSSGKGNKILDHVPFNRQNSMQENSKIVSQDDLLPLDDPAKSLNIALLDLSSKI